MIFGTKSNKIEEKIVEILHQNPLNGPSLLNRLNGQENPPSKESFYRILRDLKKEEIIHKNGPIYTLNRIWLKRMRGFIDKHIQSDTLNILDMQDGDQITYKFKSPNLMGIYWAHSGNVVFDNTPSNTPILIYHPHEWLIYTRTHSEEFFLQNFVNGYDNGKGMVFWIMGGNTPLDKKFQKEWSKGLLEIGTGIDIGAGKNLYVNVVGDYVFLVTTEKSFGEKLDEIFQKHEIMTPNALTKLRDLTEKNYKTKLVLMKNKKEAEKWKKKFKKYFLVSKDYAW
jgi:DNA-binding PadR family transcriptional regulator